MVILFGNARKHLDPIKINEMAYKGYIRKKIFIVAPL